MPGELQVVDDAGSIYSTTSLSYAGSFTGGAFDDIAFHDASSVVLRGKNLLIAYSPTLVETGRKAIAADQLRIFVGGNSVHSFARVDGRGVIATKTALADLVPVTDPDPDPDPDPVPIDFSQFKGTFFASLNLDAESGWAAGGMLKLTFDARGRATGFVRLAAKTFPFRAAFDAFGNATFTVKINGQVATIALKLAMGAHGPALTGTVTTADGAYALQGARAQKTAQPGRFLFLLTDSSPAVRDEVPPVIGHGEFVLTRAGAARIKGRLVLGGAVSQGAMLLEDGTVVLNLMTLLGQSTVTGMISPDDLPGSDWAGSIRWAKRAAPASAVYPQAIDTAIEFSAVEYAQNLPVLQLPPDKGVTIILDSGDLAEPLFTVGTLYSNGLVVTPLNASSTSALIDPKTGFLRGYFPHPVTRQPVLFVGIVNRKLNQVQGGFLGPHHGGQVRIVPGGLVPGVR
jgi:hypothetical protein